MNRRNFFSALAGIAGAAKLGPKTLREPLLTANRKPRRKIGDALNIRMPPRFQISDAGGGQDGRWIKIWIKIPIRFIG